MSVGELRRAQAAGADTKRVIFAGVGKRRDEIAEAITAGIGMFNIESVGEVEAIDAVADGFARIAPYAEEKGINLNLELLNSKVNHPGYQCDHTAWGVAVCEKVNSPRVKLLYDIYHMQIMEGDIIRSIQDNHQYFGHYHTGGNPGRNELDGTQELNYVPIARAIAETGFDGFVAHEFIPKRDPLTSLAEAVALCDV